MAGNKEGGAKAAETMKRKYGESYYARIGAIGGRNGHTGGWYDPRPWYQKLFGHRKWQPAVIAGRKGGAISKRGRQHVQTEQTA